MSLTDKLNTPTVQKHPVTIPAMLEAGKTRITSLIGNKTEATRFMASALTEIKRNPTIMKCEPSSVLGAVLMAAQLKLDIGQTGEAYLIPYGKNLQVIIGYKGLLTLSYRSGLVKSVTARAVYENDDFRYSFGLDEVLEHTPATENRGQLTHVYAIARLKDGAVHFEVMAKTEVDEIRNNAKSKNSTPWNKHYAEMAKKTVVRRLFKYLPSSTEMNQAIALDESPKQDNKPMAEAVLEGDFELMEGNGETSDS